MKNTICWDCGNSGGGCEWSKELKPVRNWRAKKTEDSYIVIWCPKFERDAWGNGRFRADQAGTEEYVKELTVRIENLIVQDNTIKHNNAKLRNELMAMKLIESTHYSE